MYKKLKMTDPDTQQFTIMKTNLNTYNTILRKSIWLQKKCTMKHALKNTKMI